MTRQALIWRNISRRKMRTLFTVLSVATAFAIFTVLVAIYQGMTGHITLVSARRLISYNELAGGRPLPVNYADKIASVPGVAAVTYFRLSQGYFIDPKNRVMISAFSPTLFDVYPDFRVSSEAQSNFARDRQGAIVGPDLAKKMNWRIGQTVPLQGGPVQQNGSTTWFFHISGIYSADLPPGYQSFFLIHYTYLNEGISSDHNRDTVGQLREIISDPSEATNVAAKIDALFRTQSFQTRTRSEDELTTSTLRQFGDIGAIVVYTGLAVFFSMLLITGNTMANSVRERFGEFAAMRALGFKRLWPVWLVLSESLTVIGAGAALGLAAGWLIGDLLKPIVSQTLQGFAVSWIGVVLGGGLGSSIFDIDKCSTRPPLDASQHRFIVTDGVKMNSLKQTLFVLIWNLRTIKGRMRSVAVAIAGFLGVILVFVATISIKDGLTQSLYNKSDENVAVLSAANGPLTPEALSAASQLPGIARSSAGPLVSGASFSVVELPNRSSGQLSDTVIYGVDGNYAGVIPDFKISSGRMFRQGVNEIIVGDAAARLYDGLELGGTLNWNHRSWRIVGTFTAGDAMRDSALIADVVQLESANAVAEQFSWIYARLSNRDLLPALKAAVSKDPRLNVTTQSLSAYDSQFGQSLNAIITVAARVITILMAIGAIFGALNIMYANVAERKGEIAVLRALGFRRAPILIAVLSETILLALTGGILGVLIAFYIFDGFEASTLAGGAQIGFKFAVTSDTVVLALTLAVGMGLLGGALPSYRAAWLPIANALRDD